LFWKGEEENLISEVVQQFLSYEF